MTCLKSPPGVTLAISPHLDDAVLCIGGHLIERSRARVKVVVLTIFAGYPLVTQLAPLAVEFHADCGLGHDAVRTRRREDEQATSLIGAEACWLDLPDAIYRWNQAKPTYPTLDALFGLPVPEDSHLRRQVARDVVTRFPKVEELLIPLGVGGHVDHRIARYVGDLVAMEIRPKRVSWYEESLYTSQKGAAAWQEVDTRGLTRSASRLSPLIHAQKLRAVQEYRSQLHMLQTAMAAGVSPSDMDHTLGEEYQWFAP